MNIRFTDLDDTDLEQKIWAWSTSNPQFRITKRHAVEMLPVLSENSIRPGFAS